LPKGLLNKPASLIPQMFHQPLRYVRLAINIDILTHRHVFGQSWAEAFLDRRMCPPGYGPQYFRHEDVSGQTGADVRMVMGGNIFAIGMCSVGDGQTPAR
jgi:hypothetical protein